MFESNFPPDKVSFSYNVMYNAFKLLSKGYSDSERADMFHGVAVRVYRIND
jgi:predicted TIM-barrel fold metal-dependent hydrolase